MEKIIKGTDFMSWLDDMYKRAYKLYKTDPEFKKRADKTTLELQKAITKYDKKDNVL